MNMAEKPSSNHDIGCNICCSRQNLKRCGVCKCTYYCSRDHQLKDWENHKQHCQTLAKGSSSNSTNASNGITPVTENEPSEKVAANDKPTHRNPIIKKHCVANDCETYCGGKCSDNESETSSASCVNNDGNGTTDAESDGFPFDSRPYEEQVFIKIPSGSSVVEVARTAVDKMNEQGFCVLDGLFTNSQIKKALTDIRKCSVDGLFNSGKLEGGITSGDEDKQVVNSGIRSDKIMWIEGTEEDLPGVTNIVSKMDAILWEFNQFLNNKYFINGRTKAMLACYPSNGTYYRRHVDNPHGDGRVVTCILYLNRGWNVQEDGGLLRILPSGSDDHIDIAPIANRLLFFWSDKRNPHEVQPAFKTRYAITVWYMDERERRLAKQKSQEGETENLRGEYVLRERHTKVIERDEVNKKIEDAASQAVASLSVDELKAMSSMVAGQPNADDVLAEMGIAANIRTKLLDRLKKLDS